MNRDCKGVAPKSSGQLKRGVKGVKLLLFLTLAASMLGQGENEPYFALMSGRTFGSGGKPTISLNGWNLDSLEFRVYRVNDPRRFFQLLEQPHAFGGSAPAPPRERTMLEQVRSWKRGLRADIRRSLRSQFTESPSAHLESLLPHQYGSLNQPVAVGNAGAGNAGRYAENPLLNPQQMVLSFTRPVGARARWDREDVDIPVSDKGVYLVEAVHHDLRAYTILFVSDLVMISKSGQGRIVNFVVDRKTGQPVPDIEVEAISKKGVAATARTDRDGIAELEKAELEKKVELEKKPALRASPDSETTLMARHGRDVAVNSVGGYEAGEWIGYIYTDRPVYRPGHTVHFKGVLRLRSADGYDVPAGRKVSVEIQDPDQKPVYQKTLTVSASGAIYDDLTMAPGAALGGYYIQVKPSGAGPDEGYMSGNFEVEAYKKPEYEVRVTPSKNRVLQGETVQAVIDARYFFGEPVSGAKVKYSVYRSTYWFPLWYGMTRKMTLTPTRTQPRTAAIPISPATS